MKKNLLASSLCWIVLSLTSLNAANKWWDISGGTLGAGGANPAGTWDTGTTANWTTDFNGGITPTTWAASDDAFFSAGSDANGVFTVTVSGTVTAKSLTFEEGTVTLSGGTLALTGSGNYDVPSGLTATIGSGVTGTTGYGKTSPGRLVLTSGASTVTGPISVMGGILEITASGNIGGTAAGAGNITLDGGTLRNSAVGVGGTFLTGNRGLVIGAGGGTIDVNGSAATILIYSSGSITGPGNTLTKTGIGTFRNTTPTATTFSKLVVNSGLYQAGADNIFGAVPGSVLADAITLNGGGISVNSGFNFVANRGITLGIGGGTIDGASSPTVLGKITGPGALAKSGTGTLTLSGNNDFSGGFNFNAGIVQFNHNNAAGSGTITVASAATEFKSTAPNIVLPNAIALATGANPRYYATSGNGLDQTGIISGLGALTRDDNGAGTIQLSGNNTFQGGLSITSRGIRFNNKSAAGVGTLAIGSGTAPLTAITLTANIPLTGTDAMPNPIALNQNFTLAAVSDLELSGAVALSSIRTVTINSGVTLTFSGAVNGPSAGLIKAGLGKLVLSGTATYTGSTAVSAGTLLVNSPVSLPAASIVTVSSGGTLGGTGLIRGPVTISSAGTLAPGASIGTLTFETAPSLNGTVAMEINKAAGPVLTSDKLVVTSGTLTYGGTLTVTATGNTLSAGDTFDLFDAGAFGGAFATFNMPVLPVGLIWDTLGLTLNGTIKVVCAGTLAASAGPNNTVCGNSIGIGGAPTASGGSGTYSYSWSPTTGLDNPLLANPTASIVGTATYTVTVTDSVGCTAVASATVTVNPRPTAVVSGNATTCNGASTIIQAALTGTGPWNVTWSDGFIQTANSSPATRSVSPSSTTTFSVTTLTDANCTAQATDLTGSATVTVNSTPSITSGPTPASQAACVGSVASFSVAADGGSLNYAWRKRDGGWGAGNQWQLSGDGANGGFFVGDSQNNGNGASGQINTSGKAWGMYANGGNTVAAVRKLGASGLTVGQTFKIDMDNGYIDSGTVGFGLQNTSGENVLEIFFVGGDSSYTINAGSVSPAPNIPFTADGLRIALTLTSASAYSVTITTPVGGASQTFTGSLLNPAGGQAITQVRLFNANAGNGSDHDLYFNNLAVGAYDDNAANYTAWNNGDNLGNGPLANGGDISGADTATLTINPFAVGDAGSYDVVVYNSCGQATSGVATLTTSVDTEPPVVNCGQHETVSCMQGWGFTVPIVTDNCDSGLVPSILSTVTNFGCGYTFEATRVWQVSDHSGNTTYCTQLVSYVDFIPPTITAGPGNITVQCLSDVPAPDVSSISADNQFDPCETSAPVVTHVGDVTTGVSPNVTITRTYRAADACNNSVTFQQTITVHDSLAPVFANCPASFTVHSSLANPASCSQVATWTPPTATDNCQLAGVTSNHTPGETFPLGATIVTYAATDDTGNSATCQFTVTVVDDTPPAITCPANITVEAGSGGCTSNVTFSVSATDNCGAVNIVTEPASGFAFPNGTTIVTSKADDGHGNTNQCSFTVTVVDTQPPVVNCGQHETVTCMQGWGFTVPIVTDNCDSGLVPSILSTVTNFGCGYTFEATRVWQVSDNSGNTTYCTQLVSSVDFTPPTITAGPANITVQCLTDIPAPDISSISADNQFDPCEVSAPVITHVGDVTNGVSPNITITRTYRAADACTNGVNFVQTITVQDTTPPVIVTCPSDRSVLGCNATVPNVTSEVVASDNCSYVVTQSPIAGSAITAQSTPITITVTDPAGNTATCTVTVTLAPPTLSINRSGDIVTITWSNGGTLVSSDSLDGPWNPVSGSASPYQVPTNLFDKQFYRLRCD